jgi:hypothetical protein
MIRPTTRDTGSAAGAGAAVGAVALTVAGAAAGVYGLYRLGRWLAKAPELTPEQLEEIQAVQEQYRDEMERIGAADRPQLKTLSLHLNEPQTLLSAASTLGYRAVAEPGLASHGDAGPLLLERNDGSRLAITRNEAGRLDIHTSADQGLLHSLMRRHTESAVSQHLAGGGMKFETARLANGEMQILAREPDRGQAGGAAEIRAQVRTNGTLWVDIDRCQGNRCDAIVEKIASAVGGTVTGSAKKEAWFQLPGEPTRTRVKT